MVNLRASLYQKKYTKRLIFSSFPPVYLLPAWMYCDRSFMMGALSIIQHPTTVSVPNELSQGPLLLSVVKQLENSRSKSVILNDAQ